MMKRRLGVAVAALFIGSLAAGCSSDSGGGGNTADKLATILKSGAEESGEAVTDEQADCLAEAYIGLIGEDAAKSIIDAGPDGVDAAIEKAMEDVDVEKALSSIEELSKCMPEMFEDVPPIDTSGM